MQVKLKNKCALVTGGSRGIGKAIVYALAETGAKVGIQYFQSEDSVRRMKSELGSSIEIFKTDLSKAMEVDALFSDVKNHFGHVDILVNNAGVALSCPIDSEDVAWLDSWLLTMDVNLNSVGLLCKKAVQHFLEIGGGRIINISSRSAHRGDIPDYIAYAASKAGMLAVTKTLARAYGKQGIRAFSIAPGFVETDMTNGFIKKFGEELVGKDISLERLTEPGDVAPLVVFLAGGLGDHMTGSTFDINAGSYLR